MAVVKKKNVEVKEEKVVTPEVEVDTTVVDTNEAPINMEETDTEEEKEGELDLYLEESKEEEVLPVAEEKQPEIPEVEVDTFTINEEIPVVEKTVRIKTRVDHRCNIGGEFYDLKAGKCYNVPMAVKYILNNAGILAPL